MNFRRMLCTNTPKGHKEWDVLFFAGFVKTLCALCVKKNSFARCPYPPMIHNFLHV